VGRTICGSSQFHETLEPDDCRLGALVRILSTTNLAHVERIRQRSDLLSSQGHDYTLLWHIAEKAKTDTDESDRKSLEPLIDFLERIYVDEAFRMLNDARAYILDQVKALDMNRVERFDKDAFQTLLNRLQRRLTEMVANEEWNLDCVPQELRPAIKTQIHSIAFKKVLLRTVSELLKQHENELVRKLDQELPISMFEATNYLTGALPCDQDLFKICQLNLEQNQELPLASAAALECDFYKNTFFNFRKS
jgi:hypothetical protein